MSSKPSSEICDEHVVFKSSVPEFEAEKPMHRAGIIEYRCLLKRIVHYDSFTDANGTSYSTGTDD